MKPAASTLEAQLFGLSTLAQLEKRARHAGSFAELAFIVVNETLNLAPYRQAVLWRRERTGRGRIAAVSGTPMVERKAPFAHWLERALARLDRQAEGTSARPVAAADLPAALAAEWPEWLPAHALWVPLVSPRGSVLGVLLLAREQPWQEGDARLVEHLADAYGHAWAALLGPRRVRLRPTLRRGRLALELALAAAAIACLWLPVPLTALAPAEVVPLEPTIVRAPIDGVVDRFHVEPNQDVSQGQLLVSFDPTQLENRREVALKALAVAEAEYRQASQQAVFDDKSRVQLALLKGRMEERRSDLAYAEALFDRIRVRASRAGIAVLDDPEEWVGRPVTIGERLLMIADPKAAEIEIWLPVGDAIALEPGAEVKLFLNVAPEDAVAGTLRYASYAASVAPDGVLAYRLKARFADGTQPPRIGLRGTAKIFGERVTLFYYLMRRPLAVARQMFGF
ncbi:MAG: efflux RND transporter periplasmic adaptor subunit [Alphaproteobacteria bacterium]